MSYTVLQLSYMKRTLWTYEPDTEVEELMQKAIRKYAGKDKRNQRGWRTKLIEESIRSYITRKLQEEES